ncbi:MAG: TatD family hydrolase [Gemmataceae bacterium]|nr:TatD family hydrolase [Gemmataceae bacterium]
MLTDTHAHLCDERLRGQLPGVLDRARAAGVGRIICVATTAADSAECLAVAGEYPDLVAPTVGVHPNHAAEAADGDWDRVVALAADPAVVALGETGLDRHWDFTPFDVQEDWFARHLTLSRATGKPVVIHCREADADVERMLRADFDRHGPVRGVLHSFCGSWATAEACLAMGLYVSFAGMITYKTADNVREVAGRVPSDRLLVETDCPFLAPVPFRGKTNEPAHVALTAAELARVRGLDPDSLFSLTSANAARLFFPVS